MVVSTELEFSLQSSQKSDSKYTSMPFEIAASWIISRPTKTFYTEHNDQSDKVHCHRNFSKYILLKWFQWSQWYDAQKPQISQNWNGYIFFISSNVDIRLHPLCIKGKTFVKCLWICKIAGLLFSWTIKREN